MRFPRLITLSIMVCDGPFLNHGIFNYNFSLEISPAEVNASNFRYKSIIKYEK